MFILNSLIVLTPVDLMHFTQCFLASEHCNLNTAARVCGPLENCHSFVYIKIVRSGKMLSQ